MSRSEHSPQPEDNEAPTPRWAGVDPTYLAIGAAVLCGFSLGCVSMQDAPRTTDYSNRWMPRQIGGGAEVYLRTDSPEPCGRTERQTTTHPLRHYDDGRFPFAGGSFGFVPQSVPLTAGSACPTDKAEGGLLWVSVHDAPEDSGHPSF